MPFLLVAFALAGPRIVAVGEPLVADGPGNWPRLFPREDGGWSLLTANQSGLVYTGLDAAFSREDGSSVQLVADDSLIDHGFATCPDGTVLHVGMGTRTSEQHTATVRRFDADWNLLSLAVPIDDDPQAFIVDQAAVCGEHFQGFSYLYFGSKSDTDAKILLLDRDDTPLAEHWIGEVYNPTGMSLLERDGKLYAIGSNSPDTESLRIVTFDTDMTRLDDRQVRLVEPPGVVYWPQGAVDVGGDTFVVYITQAVRADWPGQDGDVYLAQFDADWNIVDNVAVYALGPDHGGFQPGLALRGDELVVTFSDASYVNRLVAVTLDLTDVEPDTGGDDTGGRDTGGRDTGGRDTGVGGAGESDTGSDTGGETSADSGDPDVSTRTRAGACGCANGGADTALGPLLVVIAGLGLVRRGPRAT